VSTGKPTYILTRVIFELACFQAVVQPIHDRSTGLTFGIVTLLRRDKLSDTVIHTHMYVYNVIIRRLHPVHRILHTEGYAQRCADRRRYSDVPG
jgi:hypothetical protein